MKKIIFILTVLIMSIGFANAEKISVNAVNQKIKSVCIMVNPSVTVANFVQETQSVLESKNIKVYLQNSEDKTYNCQASLKYDAHRKWWGITYLSDVNYTLYETDNKQLLGTADFVITSGYDLSKYHAKVKDVVPKLLDKMIPTISN